MYSKTIAKLLALSSVALLALTVPAVAVHAQDAATTAAALDPATLKAREKQVREWKKIYGEGPYPDEVDGFVNPRFEVLRPYYKALYMGGERNAVLNLSRLGLAAMELGQWTDAERAFDGALLRIEAVYAKNASAEAARSLFHKESNKDWKGEPYERAMAYYYRGLLYLRKGDYNNARAAFKGGEYQDTVSETEEFQSDFAVMNYLMGWAEQCAGDSGASSFEAALKAEKLMTAPVAGDNVLMIAELGHGPVKARDGKQKEKLIFQTAQGYPETGAVFTLTPVKGAPRTIDGRLASSVYYQATTRGGRAMDGILDGKASWKSTTSAIGGGATQVGLQLMNNNYGGNNMAGAGAAIAVAGLLFSAFSTAMKTEADIRQWDSLPDGLALSTAKLDGAFVPTVNYVNAGGSLTLAPTPIMLARAGKCAIVWTRARTALLGADTPGDDPKVVAAVRKKKDVAAKDKLFRTALNTTYGN